MPRIILCMIVKNEAHVLSRALASAIPIIDAACICDTGSTDDTVAIAHDVLSRAEIPHHLVPHEWINFGVNRTRSFEETRSVAKKLGWDLEQTYALFLDADMVLRTGDDFNPDDLSAGGYMLRQGNGSFQYDNTRLARLSVDWRCIGATHEFWAPPEGTSVERLKSLWIHDVGDGGSKADKFKRDIELLEADLEADPDNPRTIFYLAQSYHDIGDYQKARELYKERAGLVGWEEESWYAAYRVGMCSLQLDEWDRAVAELMTAWQRRPTRAEPLYQLSRAARKRNAHHIAMLTAEKAVKIPIPEDDTLFIDGAAYRHGPVEEISVSAFYTGDREQGLTACDALIHDRSTPSEVKNLATNNVAFYVQPLARAETRRVDVPLNLIPPTFSPSVGSISRTDDGYVMVNRILNYYINDRVDFITRDPRGRYLSKELWLTLDCDLNLCSARAIDDALVDEVAQVPPSDGKILGLEDVRLIRWKDQWWFTGSSSQFNPRNVPCVVLGRIDPDQPRIEHVVPLAYARQRTIEKNWLPFVHRGRLLLVYSSDPTIILEPDPETGHCREIHRSRPSVDLSRLRGSSPLVPLGDDRSLFVVHEVTYYQDTRIYMHRLAEMDSSFEITRLSHPFTFQHAGVEYACGLCLSHNDEDVIISCNWEERESWLVTVPRQQIEEMMIPIEDLARYGKTGERPDSSSNGRVHQLADSATSPARRSPQQPHDRRSTSQSGDATPKPRRRRPLLGFRKPG